MSWGVLHVGFQDPYGLETPDFSNIPPRLPKVGDRIYLMHHGRGLRPSRKVLKVEAGKIVTKQDDPKHFFAVEIGEWGERWRFASDPKCNPMTDLELQLIDIRVQRRIGGGETIPHRYRKVKVPACHVCKQWPCVKQSGCPDYESLAGGNNRASLPPVRKEAA